MNCPICDYKGLAHDAMNCPSCNADLSAYRSINDVEKAMAKQKRRTLLFIILFFLALLGCIAVYFIFAGGEDVKEKPTTEIQEAEAQNLKAENENLAAELKQLESEVGKLKADLKTAKENQLIIHVVSEGESLFTIAEKYYGDGEKFLKIADDNCIDDPDFIVAGTELIILK